MGEMFGDDERIRELAEFLLSQFTLEELLEMNDLTEEEVVVRLIENGLITEPERILTEV